MEDGTSAGNVANPSRVVGSPVTWRPVTEVRCRVEVVTPRSGGNAGAGRRAAPGTRPRQMGTEVWEAHPIPLPREERCPPPDGDAPRGSEQGTPG